MSNQSIGIASVFGLTFLLFVLRQCFLSLGRPGRSAHVGTPMLRGDRGSNIKSGDDHGWLMWSADREAQAKPGRQ